MVSHDVGRGMCVRADEAEGGALLTPPTREHSAASPGRRGTACVGGAPTGDDVGAAWSVGAWSDGHRLGWDRLEYVKLTDQ